MKESVGIKKELDNLGRLVIPKEMRERYCLNSDVELVATEDGILIRSPEYVLIHRSALDEDKNNYK